VLDYDLVDLAQEFAKGLQPANEGSEWSLVERGLYSTIQQAYEQLAFRSSHDELTGLINRKECDRQLNNVLCEAKNKWNNHCLLHIDIDKFSLANNLYGHHAGDELLKDIAQLLLDKAPENASCARMAGDEFAIILRDHNLHDGNGFAEQLRQAIDQQPLTWQEHNAHLTVSIGIVAINKYTASTIDLLRDAASAAKNAKKAGGNRCHEFSETAKTTNQRDKLLSWIDQINNTLTQDRLVLRGQAIQSASGEHNISHYEILLAIKNELGELESPVDFIEAAECYNRMSKVDRWIIERVFEWLSSLEQAGFQTPEVSINLSGNSLNDEQFVDFLLTQFAKHQIVTSKICFEVTETATINNLSSAADFIRQIKRIGCKTSLDDYGSGNASYQYLKHLPVDNIKIDGAFIKDILQNPDDLAMVKSINDIAHLMGKKTIAEYVESEEIAAVLKDIGVDYMQGYALSMPTPLDQLEIHRRH
jgi:diguanylate cyclase (GGDEF)-like protein